MTFCQAKSLVVVSFLGGTFKELQSNKEWKLCRTNNERCVNRDAKGMKKGDGGWESGERGREKEKERGRGNGKMGK
jgi:hypothetical protein